MAAAGAPADEGLFIEVRELRTMVQGLDTTVTNISLSVQQLTQDMSDLHSRHDGGVYGETYANDSGPAIRAKYYESFLEEVQKGKDQKDQLKSITMDAIAQNAMKTYDEQQDVR